MRKKLSILCSVMLLFGCMAGSAFAVSYCQDFLEAGNPGGRTTGLKTCDAVNPETVTEGTNFSMDIWATDLPESIISSGFLMTFNPAQVSLVSVQAYDGVDIVGGPWDGSGTFKIPEPSGPGSYILGLVQLSCAVPDAGGDVIIAKVTFQCLASGDTDIEVTHITDFDTTVGCASGTNYDPEMGTNRITITQTVSTLCTDPSDCNDNDVCTTDTCNVGTGECQYAQVVCNDDGNACTSNACDSVAGCNYPAISCDDGDLCTDDSCDPATGCANVPKDCDDSSLCTNDTCNLDTGDCLNVAISCDDTNLCTDDSCDPATGCVNAPKDCSDGDLCTDDNCDPANGNCLNPATDCSDGIDCTDDSCTDPNVGCVNTPNDGNCPDDGLYCNGTEFCDANTDCTSSGNPCPLETRVCIEDSDECRVPACSITLEPPSSTVEVQDDLQFTVVVEGTCDNVPSYTWELSDTSWTGCTGGAGGSAIGSTIDATGLYTAGNSAGVDNVRVTDYNNGEICAFAEVTVITTTTTTSIRPTSTTTSVPSTTTTVEVTTTTTTPETTTTTTIGPTATLSVRPERWFQSRWVPLPMLLNLNGEETNFERRVSVVTFQPANAVLRILTLVVNNNNIAVFAFMMPQWLTGPVETVEVTVTTGSEVVSDNVSINLLPFFLEEGVGKAK